MGFRQSEDQMKSQLEKSKAFEALHQRGNCFVIPNPWDCGSAKLLEHMGFNALASTGAGYAFSQGRSDLSVDARSMLPHLAQLAAATDLPLSADLQNGFGDTPEAAAQAITAAAGAGAVGGSIEDASGDAGNPLYDVGLQRAPSAMLEKPSRPRRSTASSQQAVPE